MSARACLLVAAMALAASPALAAPAQPPAAVALKPVTIIVPPMLGMDVAPSLVQLSSVGDGVFRALPASAMEITVRSSSENTVLQVGDPGRLTAMVARCVVWAALDQGAVRLNFGQRGETPDVYTIQGRTTGLRFRLPASSRADRGIIYSLATP